MENVNYKKMYEKAKSDMESLHHSFMDVRGRNEHLIAELEEKNKEIEMLTMKYNDMKKLYSTAKQVIDGANKFIELVTEVSLYTTED